MISDIRGLLETAAKHVRQKYTTLYVILNFILILYNLNYRS